MLHVRSVGTFRTYPIRAPNSPYAPTGFAAADLFRIDEAFCCRMVEIEMR